MKCYTPVSVRINNNPTPVIFNAEREENKGVLNLINISDDFKQIIVDINYINSFIPEHYTCTCKIGEITFKSQIGIPNDFAGDDSWGNIEKKIRDYFGKRLKEIKHRVKVCHIFFTIVLNEPF